MDVEKTPAPACTCPSGDGSLRSPCPAHGALPAIKLQHEPLGFVLFPLSPAAVAPHVVEYIVGFDFDEVRDVYGERFAVFWQGLVALFLGQPSAQATLAARQPGAPVAWLIHWSHIPLEAPEVTTSASRVDAVSALTDPPRIEPLYAASPAQGIDLGQQRPLIARSLAEWHEDDGNVMWWAWCGQDWAGEPAWCGTPNDSDWPGYHTHWTQQPVEPALIDRRDATPGVSS